ncbi:MAG: Autoinducer 2 sensor kinase/phosphatase LuxQ [Luteibacter sp.]|uniref:response regulator n=1 Tax=Luteibacter sp. TaxID=1886636 RepID=UPI001382710B|nr:response regulator [Luteibacter sp.]KAF1007263.1 MAG: Autoinducer 2 sensor kinase/phosphatase LuxQ [Luteibacter sp.]
MTSNPKPRPPRRTRADLRTLVALGIVIVFFICSGLLAAANIRTIRDDNSLVIRSQETVGALGDILSSVQDAETGQRGFLLTGNDRYLEPYRNALGIIPARLDAIGSAVAGDAAQSMRLREMRARIQDKLEELRETIELRRSRGLDAALGIVNSDRGKAAMDDIRARLTSMRAAEYDQRAKRLAEMETAYSTAWTSGGASALLGIGLTFFVGVMIRRNSAARERDAWLQAGRLELGAAMAGDKDMGELSGLILSFLARFLRAEAGVLFTPTTTGFDRSGAVGVAPDDADGESRPQGSLLSRAVEERRVVVVSDVPETYFQVGSGLGKAPPRHLVIAPAVSDGQVQGVLELGFFHAVDAEVVELLEQASPAIAIALRSAAYRAELSRLLEETLRQSETLQTQGEELRVSNEELEEQSRALRESQQELESQQAELEQTNAHLAGQSQQLEAQRDELALANEAIEAKAREVQRSSQYKSEFLANMSHELRTPLNSALILSKLLADNTPGNLTDEQVKFARTIHTSGNDLLTLINDILDLSKIEAGHIEVRGEPFETKGLLDDLSALFAPVANEKGLALNIAPSSDCPAFLESDRLRIEQVLKNLLSNALKFTEAGSVTLAARAGERGTVVFSVTDTGIGIATEQQSRIFDAFQQADGSISRRYGGTGLGLSISLELARLLGGDISVASDPGHGSTFSLEVPVRLVPGVPVVAKAPAPAVRPMSRPIAAPMPVLPVPAAPVLPAAAPGDTRHLILVIEDDRTFAEIVSNLAVEMGFRTVTVSTGAEALAAAREHLPHAIVLDIGLPDQSGLSVLDILKHDVRTRHIPIHVVSGEDHARTALSLGAVGYLVKPTTREELARVLDSLEARLSQTPRRVLVVEDDAVQLDAIRHLLASADVETVGAATAADCLSLLQHQTFDCMVLDLSLPDTSGFALLETLSNQETYAFPPAIVYTGRVLSTAEEERLRRYSSSIIIKGARSPERLLDEVTLFLHRVIAELPEAQQDMIRAALNRDGTLEGRRILLVEDDVRNVYALMSVLEPHGCEVTIARNGQEAIDALNATLGDTGPGIDLVLMDIMMPVKDGLTATREIRENPRFANLPIIALTAKAMPDDQQQCLQAGANDYVAKPLDVDKLLSLIRVWLTAP